MRRLLAIFTAVSISLLTFVGVQSANAQETKLINISQIKVGGDIVGEMPQ